MKSKAQRKKPFPNGKRCRNIRSTAERQISKAKKATSAAEKRLELQTDQLKGERDKRRRAEERVEELETVVRLMVDGYSACDICLYGANFGGECESIGCGNCEKERCQCHDCVSGCHLKLAERYRKGGAEE